MNVRRIAIGAVWILFFAAGIEALADSGAFAAQSPTLEIEEGQHGMSVERTGQDAPPATLAPDAVSLVLAPPGVYPAPGTIVSVNPKKKTIFTLEARIDNPNARPMDGVGMHVDYDPTVVVLVKSATDPTPATTVADGDGSLPLVLQNTVDGAGHADFAYGRNTNTGAWSGNTLTAKLYFQRTSQTVCNSSPIRFALTWPRETKVAGAGQVVPHLLGGVNIAGVFC